MHDDELIDLTAHAMTRGEPSPHLRGAVRARIASRRPRLAPGPWRRWQPAQRVERRQFWITALAGAVIVILAIMVSRTVLEPRGELLRSTRIASELSVTPSI